MAHGLNARGLIEWMRRCVPFRLQIPSSFLSANMSATATAAPPDAQATAIPGQATVVPVKESKAEARARRKAEAIARTLAAQQQQQPTNSADAASSPAARPSNSGLCEFYLARKHRLCSFPISSSSARFCAHHNSCNTDAGNDKVLCPFCGTAIRAKDRPHAMETAAEAATASSSAPASSSHPALFPAPHPSPLDRHMQICPKRLMDVSATQLPFYDKSCNGVWRTEDGVAGATTASDAGAASAPADENPDGHAPVSAAVSSLSEVPRAELMALIDKLQSIAARLAITPESLRKIEERQLELLQQSPASDAAQADSKPEDADAMIDAPDASVAPTAAPSSAAASPSLPAASPAILSHRSRSRHNLQHAAFFRVLAAHGIEFGPAADSPSSAASSSAIVAPGSVVIEVGAGKAGLSGFIAGNMTASSAPSSSASPASDASLTATNKRAKFEAATPTPASAVAASTAAPAAAPADAASASDVPHAPLTLVVLDRGSFKHKADTAMRRSASCRLVRHRVDLQDVRLELMQEVKATQATQMIGANKPVVIVTGKHVCGQATDFVLRAVARANAAAVSAAAASPAPVAPLISAVCIATCCHHLCSWSNYVAPQWWVGDLGLDAADFARVARMSSWYTCGHQQHSEHRAAAASIPASAPVSTDAAAAADPLTPALKTWVGFVCKQLLDLGRVHFLSREARLARVALREAYTHSSITREHFVILASA